MLPNTCSRSLRNSVASADDDDVVHGSTPFWSGARCDGHARRSITIVILQREKKRVLEVRNSRVRRNYFYRAISASNCLVPGGELVCWGLMAYHPASHAVLSA